VHSRIQQRVSQFFGDEGLLYTDEENSNNKQLIKSKIKFADNISLKIASDRWR
jgi:hypothetical protein